MDYPVELDYGGFMKKLVLILALVLVMGGALFADVDWTSYPSGLGPGHPMLNIGIGIGYNYGWKLKVPPILASIDFPVELGGIPFSFGGGFGMAMYGYDYGNSSSGYTYRYTNMVINGRFAYHPNLGVPNLDVYPILTLGMRLRLYKYEGRGYYSSGWSDSSGMNGYFDFGAGIGIRYYFSNFFGIYAEAGYTGLTWINAGLTLKF